MESRKPFEHYSLGVKLEYVCSLCHKQSVITDVYRGVAIPPIDETETAKARASRESLACAEAIKAKIGREGLFCLHCKARVKHGTMLDLTVHSATPENLRDQGFQI